MCSKARSPDSSLTSARSVFSSTKGEVCAGARCAQANPAARKTKRRIVAPFLIASLEGQNHEGPIVGGRRAACVRRDSGEDRIPETLRIRGSLGAKEPLQPLETKGSPSGLAASTNPSVTKR